ncbi:MAG: transglycosylase SLT domain-containing protein [Candidatus Melainabacteria bacterium]|nr:transglycosylase SLT domain-containing protein [Candidatus Melainabacteria bacterium]
MTEQTRESVGEANRFSSAGGVDMPHAQTDNMGSFGTRDVPRQPSETDKQMALKEAVAGLFRPDSTAAYETVRKHPDGSYRVGRYGFSGNQLLSLLDSLGDPPDPALIERLIKEGKLPKGFAEKLKNPEFLKKFKEFAKKLQSGQEPSKDELKQFLPKDAQESFGSMLIEQMQGKVGDNPGAIATAILSGKSASELNQSDFTTPEAKQLISAGQQLYETATKRQSTEQQVVGNIPQGERRQLIEQALTLSGVPATDANLAAVNLIVEHESAWDPNAVNNWDSNAAAGTPSKGLMQTIGPTFNSYSLPGHKNILNPLDNMIAGIRYAVSRYGSLQNVPGVKAIAGGLAYRGY